MSVPERQGKMMMKIADMARHTSDSAEDVAFRAARADAWMAWATAGYPEPTVSVRVALFRRSLTGTLSRASRLLAEVSA